MVEAAKSSIYIELIKYVINHELSHTTNLAQPWNSTHQYHQAAEAGYLMEKTMKMTTRGDIIFTLPTQYYSTDPPKAKLRGPADLQ